VSFFFTTVLALACMARCLVGDQSAKGENVKTPEHEDTFFRDIIAIRSHARHSSLGLFLACRGVLECSLLIISGPSGRWLARVWNWWLNFQCGARMRERARVYYQNIFTQVQVRSEPEPDRCSKLERTGKGFSFICSAESVTPKSDLFTRLPRLALVGLRLHSLRDHSLNVGFGQLDPVQFVRQLPWLALEPPKPNMAESPSTSQ